MPFTSEVTTPKFVEIGLVFGALNWVSLWYREGGRLTGAQIADEIADTFLRALRP